MPQLDPVPFASIYLWFVTTFFLTYFLFLKYILPHLSQWMKIQNKEQISNIYWLFIYHALSFRKDYLSKEALVKFANLSCSVELLLKNIDLLVNEFIDLTICSDYEKGSFYLTKECL